MLNIVLSRTARTAVNSLVRGHSGFEAFRLENGAFDSRNMTKDILMQAIENLGLEAAVRDIVASAAPDAPDAPEAEKVWLAGKAASGMATPVDGGDMAETVMGPLRPFLSPVLLDAVATALAPIVALAIKPQVTVTKTVTVDADGKPVATPEAEAASRVGASTLGKLFGTSARLKYAGTPVSLWDATDAPEIDPFFVPDLETLAKLVTAIDPASGRAPRNIWLFGPAGTGKSSTPEQIAARARRPFVSINFHRAVEPTDMLGMKELDGKGGMLWVDAVLTRAIRKPGTIVLLDEITFGPPGLLATLQTLLSSRKLTLSTGEIVPCADGVVFVVADNTNGSGDESGLYAGTVQSNVALVDRMGRMIRVDYLPHDLETQALANHTKAPHAACGRVVAFVNSARKLTGFSDRPISIRRQIAFVEMASDGFPVADSFADTMLNHLPDAERETLRIHFKTAFDAVAFDAEMSGAQAPLGLSDSPEQIAARGVDGFTVIDPTNT